MPKLLTFNELRDHGVLYTRRYIDDLERAGKFPRRVPIGEHRIGWVATEVDAYVDLRIAARSDVAGSLGSADGTKKKRGKPPRSSSPDCA